MLLLDKKLYCLTLSGKKLLLWGRDPGLGTGNKYFRSLKRNLIVAELMALPWMVRTNYIENLVRQKRHWYSTEMARNYGC